MRRSDRYEDLIISERKPFVWPGNKTLAVWIAPNVEVWNYDSAEGQAVSPNLGKIVPDVVNYRIAGAHARSDRCVGGSHDDLGGGRSVRGLRPIARRSNASVDDKEQHAAYFCRLPWLQGAVWRICRKPRNSEAGKAIVVHKASVKQLDEGHRSVSVTGNRVGKLLQHWRGCRIVPRTLDPFGDLGRTPIGERLQHDRSENSPVVQWRSQRKFAWIGRPFIERSRVNYGPAKAPSMRLICASSTRRNERRSRQAV